MSVWLLKTEPSTYSFDDLVRAKRATWDGVTSPAAVAHLRSVREGDTAWVYHSGAQRAIVGLARVVRGAFADPKRPGLTAAGHVKFAVIDLEAIAPARVPITLAVLKGDRRFANLALMRQTRLSVMPVPPALDTLLRRWGGV